MLKGFKEFVARGSVVDLAVGFVMGAAFTTVVTQFTASFLEPLIRVFTGGDELAGSFTIRGQQFDWAAFVNAVITFLLIAAVVYFLVVLPMNRLAERRRRGEEPVMEQPSAEVRLLTEIRDQLVAARVPEQPPGSQSPSRP